MFNLIAFMALLVLIMAVIDHISTAGERKPIRVWNNKRQRSEPWKGPDAK